MRECFKVTDEYRKISSMKVFTVTFTTGWHFISQHFMNKHARYFIILSSHRSIFFHPSIHESLPKCFRNKSSANILIIVQSFNRFTNREIRSFEEDVKCFSSFKALLFDRLNLIVVWRDERRLSMKKNLIILSINVSAIQSFVKYSSTLSLRKHKIFTQNPLHDVH